MTGNGLAITSAQHVGVLPSDVPIMLWPNAQKAVKQLLNTCSASSGELIHENDISINRKGSSRHTIKGHHPEKVGIPACRLAAQAVEARGASLIQRSSERDMLDD